MIDSISAGGKLNVPVVQRIYWASMEGVIAAVLLFGGGTDALGIIAGTCLHLSEITEQSQFQPNQLQSNPHNPNGRLKVPHMGWNQVQHFKHPLWKDIDQQSWFYFVHSYWVDAADSALVAGTFDYGVTGAAALARDNLFAVQFHPEKSHDLGLRLLSNFLTWNGQC